MFGLNHLIDKKRVVSIIILGLISGFISFAFLAFINYMISLILKENDDFKWNNIILFCILLLAFVWSRKALSYLTIKFSQEIFWRLRTDVLRTLLKADYEQLNKKRDQIYSSLTHDIGALTSVSLSIIQFISSLFILLSCLVYMGYQSITLCVLTIVVALVGAVVYQFGSVANNKLFEKSRDLENGFIRYFQTILSGFKEIHMNPKIGQEIYDRKLSLIAKESYKNNVKALTRFLNNQITGQVFFYSLIVFILLFYKSLTNVPTSNIISFVFILLYLLNAVESIMILLPGLIQGRISAKRLNQLRSDLKKQEFKNEVVDTRILISEFEKIQITELSYVYSQNKTTDFSIKEINLTINKGDLIFIYGGNGSGKTTFINVLTGIYKRTAGEIKYNNEVLDNQNYNNYRTMFSVVYSDFYLFDEFFGVDSIDLEIVNNYLKMFELEEKVEVHENGFSTIELSTGQKKRLALIAALMENRPVLVLDEWAADQDPLFRRKFYEEIIPLLIEEGLTIIAITHDDAYYKCAHKLLKMEYGKLKNESGFQTLK